MSHTTEFVDEGAAMLRELLSRSQNITFLGGAGVSTESGMPDFRSKASIDTTRKTFGRTPEEILTEGFFYEHTDVFYTYYRECLLKEALPNRAHIALSALEKRGCLGAVVTQNVDTLHEQAGSRRVLHLHGSVEWNRCTECRTLFDAAYMRAYSGTPRCAKCGALIKPEVVLYGEPLDEYILRAAKARMFASDTLIIGGTSLAVQPAASLIEFFMGKHIIVINKEETRADKQASLIIRASIGEVLGKAILDAPPQRCVVRSRST